MKKIVLTGGGSAGHVTPHLALLPHLLKEGYEVHYIGTQDGIEHGMVGNLPGVTYHVVKSGKLRRYFDWKNFTDPFRVIAGAFQSAHLMRRLKPDVCFSKGGFVSVPVVVGAWLHGVPVLCHESDLTPGLANKICTRFAKKVATTFPECAQALSPKGVFTGTPLRPELFSGNREKGLAMAHFTADKPVLLMMGGSLGVVSALILGQAAAEADLVSPLLIVLVALSGLGSFVMPDYTSSIALRIAQLALVVAAGLAGYFGLVLCLLILMLHIFAQTSLGAPLCAPFAPRRARNPDLALRMPVWRQRLRGYLSNPAAMLRSRGRMRAWEKKDE